MSLTYAQKFSFCETIEELLGLHEDDLKAAGLDAAAKKKALTDAATAARKADAGQEGVKAALIAATEKAVAALDEAYLQASSTTDAMVGVLKKDSALAKRLRKLREEMNRADSDKKPDQNKG